MVQTDAERHNNGEQMMSDWRMDMVEFWNCNHNKYLSLGHRLLAGNYSNKNFVMSKIEGASNKTRLQHLKAKQPLR